MDPKVVHVWDCIVKDDLKELIDITYTKNMHILFGSLSHNNFTVKCNDPPCRHDIITQKREKILDF